MGWYAMAITDVLDHLPGDHPKRDAILSIFQRTISAIVAVLDQATGLARYVLGGGTTFGVLLD